MSYTSMESDHSKSEDRRSSRRLSKISGPEVPYFVMHAEEQMKTTSHDHISQEVSSIKCVNNSLHTYLEHLREFKKQVVSVNDNFKHFNKVNKEWVDTIKNLK